MMAIALAMVLAGPAEAPITPDAVTRMAYLDVYDDTAPEDRRYTRYLSLHATPAGERAASRKTIDYAANATSFRSEFGKPGAVGDLLIKLDLRAFGWDYGSRHKRLAELERRGADFGLKDAEARRLLLDPWEALGKRDPYFEANHYDASGGLVVGWVGRDVTNAFRQVTYSTKPVLRADWAIGALLLEKSFGGNYSDMLMFPPKEADFYKAFLIDIDAYQRDNLLIHGGAVLESAGVALNNRELQTFPNPYGHAGIAHAWRTLDVNVDARSVKGADGVVRTKSVVESLRGTIVHDGRESLGTLPNGLFWWQLYNNSSGKAGGTGDRVDVVPEDIAQVHTPLLPPRDTRVYGGGAKCLECHTSGLKDFADVVRALFTDPAATIEVKSYDKYAAADLASAIEDYYSSDLGRTLRFQQDAYLDRLKGACGMTGPETATNVVGAVETYRYDRVGPDQVARDMGYDLPHARLAWMAASRPYVLYGVPYPGNPQLVALATGQSLPRGIYEQSFGDAMRGSILIGRNLNPKTE